MQTLDLRPSCDLLAHLVGGTTEADLARPTPCPAYAVGDLVDHVGGLTRAFAAAARKLPEGGGEAGGDASRLEPGWRERIAADLVDLADAWRDPAAHRGETRAGPVDLPAAVAFLVAVNEVVVHAWDLAVATGQGYRPDSDVVAVCLDFVGDFDAPTDDGGLFGPPVPVAADAPALDQLLGLAGRDPAWRPPVT